MGDLVYLPVYAIIVTTLMLGTITQLETLANETSEITVEYTEEMVRALDCAYTARPLTECSPNLLSREVADEITRTNQILLELQG